MTERKPILITGAGGRYDVLSDQLETLLGRPPRTMRWALQNNARLRELAVAPSH